MKLKVHVRYVTAGHGESFPEVIVSDLDNIYHGNEAEAYKLARFVQEALDSYCRDAISAS
jgi:hypothetical protein